MNKSGISLTLFLLLLQLIILSHQILSVVCESGLQQNDEKPSLFSTTISLLKKSHKNSWEKIKTIVHGFQLQFTPPNLEGTGTGTGGLQGAGKKMEAAVKNSIGTNKATVEETAKSAAEAIQKTADKVKGSVSDKQESHDEL